MENLIIFGLLFFLLFVEVPIAFAVGIITILAIYLTGVLRIDVVPLVMIDALDCFPLLSAPFFILAGIIMGRTKISDKLISFMKILFGARPGTTAVILVVASAFFAALSGSAVATVAAIGGILMPVLIREGYRPEFAAALAAAAGCLGPIIPPSIGFILVGVILNTSIADLFLAGFLPGCLVAMALLIVVKINMNIWGYKEIKVQKRSYTFKEKLVGAWDAKWALMMPVIILGSIYGGIATPTEAAVIAVDYALVVGLFIEKDLKFKDIPPIFLESLMAIGITVGILACASAFGKVIMIHQVPNKLVTMMYGITNEPWIILLLVNIFLLINGCIVDSTASIIIYTPLLWPICEKAGLDKLSFGCMELVNIVTGLITPPVAVALFIASAISGVTIRQMVKYIWQMFVAWVAVLFLITYVPKISTFLPNFINSLR
jgi:C4-dicarboxylate transporter DctM subunit